MKALVIGATGTIGMAVADALAAKHEVLRASRNGTELKVDISEPATIKGLFAKTGRVDAVVCCAGDARFGALDKLSDADFTYTLHNKLMGQVNLVRFGVDFVNDNGVFVLTSGIFSQKPMPGVPAIAIANGALESFARAAALDLPRGIRIVTIAPPFIKESAEKMGMTAPFSAAENAKAYVAVVEGKGTGEVIFPG
jgi:NAD(P)-dependent dehydrogenase (short-subunit alcohol dehydrogenase family)